MNTVVKSGVQSVRILAGAAVLFFAGCAGMGGTNSTQVTLSGAQEVPPVTTAATGFGTITIGEDKSVSGSVTTSGVVGVRMSGFRAFSTSSGESSTRPVSPGKT